MSSPGSVTLWIVQLKQGDREAVQRVWEGYYQRLVELARSKLRSAPRRVASEEDVALSAFNSFFEAARQGRFPRLEDRDDLWQILVLLASRKAVNLIKYELAGKRDARRAVSLAGGSEGEDGPRFLELISAEPDPALAAEMAESCERLLGELPDERLRQVALWKLEGYSNAEIGEKIGRAVATVERKLGLIRRYWEKYAPEKGG